MPSTRETFRRRKINRPKCHKKNIFVLLGSSGVGKSCILRRFNDGIFIHHHRSTVGCDMINKIMRVDDYDVQLEVWDTCGQERYKAICPIYYRKADAAIIVYDISNYKSFKEAKDWCDEVELYAPIDSLKILVGNKIDLDDGRQVDENEAKSYARQKGIIFFETSAKDDINIQEMFLAIARTTPFSKEEVVMKDTVRLRDVRKKFSLECLFPWIRKSS